MVVPGAGNRRLRGGPIGRSMKLPNGELAVVDGAKLREYCLNPHHARGRHKARVFATIDIHQDDSEILREALLAAARQGEARPGEVNQYGQRYRGESSPAHNLLCTISEEGV